MPACIMFVINAMLDSVQNPFLNQLIADFCISPQFKTSLLPSIFNTKYDQIIAGIFMLGVHKLGILISIRLGVNDKDITTSGHFFHERKN
ncbi:MULTISPECIES: hypothetical protein [Allobacillus]|uniref:Uncharacterized protein n=1 Tax=Allobacillus salarius TaxID=1955272 RepID=A0A556PDR6_9BACI|nr:hypothetical protein [Allobacillus salarius]TSJ62504.1 hypothetical protein FPQ13_09935 [Allobacillus salarius]